MTRKPHDVLATREARAQLPALLERFRQAGADAEPVVIGARRRPEAVVLSYERYLQLAGGRERVAASGAPSADSGACAPSLTQTSSSRPRSRRPGHRARSSARGSTAASS